MAIVNEILAGRINRFAQKLFSMKGPASLRQLAGEVVTIVPLFNGAENRYLEGWERFGQLTSIGAAAGNTSEVRMRNPANSGVIAVVERITYFATALLDQPTLGILTTNLDYAALVTVVASRLDARGRPRTSMIFSAQNAAGGAGAFNTVLQIQVPVNTTGDFIITDIQEIPLLPGDAFTVASNVVNIPIFVSWMWRERPLEDSEKA